MVVLAQMQVLRVGVLQHAEGGACRSGCCESECLHANPWCGNIKQGRWCLCMNRHCLCGNWKQKERRCFRSSRHCKSVGGDRKQKQWCLSQYRHCKAVHGRETGKVVPSQEQALQVGLWLQEYKQGCLCGSRHCKLVRGARKQKWWCLGKNRHCNGVMETGNRVSGAFTGGGKASRFAVTDSRNGGALVGAGDCKLVCGDRKQKVRCF